MKVRTILETECFFSFFQECIRTIMIKIEKIIGIWKPTGKVRKQKLLLSFAVLQIKLTRKHKKYDAL